MKHSNGIAGSLRAALAAAVLIGAVGGMFGASEPAYAQFSESYKFLEAVRKKEGQKVTDALNEPGSQIVNTRDVTTGESGLHIVTARRDLTWMQFLVGHGANVNARDARGTTPLVLAANLSFLEGVDYLIASGAKVDEPKPAEQIAAPEVETLQVSEPPLVRLAKAEAPLPEGCRGSHVGGAPGSGPTCDTSVLMSAEGSGVWSEPPPRSPERAGVTLDVYVCNYSTDNSDKATQLLNSLVRLFDPDEANRQSLERGQLGVVAS
jgi:ankyrin repeat protein